MKNYTEEEVKKIVHYVASYQKAHDYVTAGHFLIGATESEDGSPDGIEKLLDELSDSDNNVTNTDNELPFEEIIKEVREMIEEEWKNKMDEEYTSPYCPVCTSCGEEGCCSPLYCEYVESGYYCESNLEHLKFGYECHHELYELVYDDKEKNAHIIEQFDPIWDKLWDKYFNRNDKEG